MSLDRWSIALSIKKIAAKVNRCLGVLLCCCLFSTYTAAQTQSVAGKVMFVAGGVELERTDVKVAISPIKGDALLEGDKLRTSETGYIYVRMADGALLVVRPQSSLQINHWQYDPIQPENSLIKYTLQSGVARYVSGKGSQAAKDKFRFNTPIAAIGIRGTDFTVRSISDVTQVSVASGGIVVGSLGGSCLAEALGPCSGSQVSELFANNINKIVEVSLSDPHPRIIDLPKGLGIGDKNSPAEPLSKNNNVENLAKNPLGVDDRDPITVDIGKVNPAQPVTPIPNTTWGRWGNLKNGDDVRIVNDVLTGRTLISMNRYYVLALNPGVSMELPGSGVGQFKIVSHQGVMLNQDTKLLEDTQASNARLSIDFASRRFSTSMDLTAGGKQTNISTQGSIEANGVMNSDPFVSATKVGGFVNSGQASYIYQRAAESGIEVSGVTHWAK